jgi:ribosomal protein S27AE
MTEPDIDDRDACPICGGILRPASRGLYCGNCDLVYEADADDGEPHEDHS